MNMSAESIWNLYWKTLILHSVLFFFAYSVITYIKFMKRLQMCQREELLGPTQLKYNIVQIC